MEVFCFWGSEISDIEFFDAFTDLPFLMMAAAVSGDGSR